MILLTLIISIIILVGSFFLYQNEKKKNQEKIGLLEKELEEKEVELKRFRELEEGGYNKEIADKKLFIRTISHELRIPISIIKGYSDILLDGFADEDEENQKRYLKKIGEKAEQLTNLFAHIVSQMDSPTEFEIKKTIGKCNLTKIITEIAEDFIPEAKKKDISIEVLPTEKEMGVFCDEVRINQIVGNIINNSIKYMGKPGAIQLSLGYSSPEEVTLVIRDNGVGMDRNEAKEIFEKSKGLGLKICKECVEYHGGSIWCKSENGKGLAIYITLPVNGNA